LRAEPVFEVFELGETLGFGVDFDTDDGRMLGGVVLEDGELDPEDVADGVDWGRRGAETPAMSDPRPSF
jgi:hypothetical protein